MIARLREVIVVALPLLRRCGLAGQLGIGARGMRLAGIGAQIPALTADVGGA